MLIQLYLVLLILTSVACATCGTFCSLCGDNGCKICMYPNTYILNGICNFCTTSCSTCGSSSNCTLCNHNYYLSNGFCFYCGDGCQQCTNGVGCTTCKDLSLGCYQYPSIQPASDSINLGLIIGLSLGGIVLTIIVIIILCRRYRSSPDIEPGQVGQVEPSI
jgi:hypothetical protein